jgi:hypothetical protein
MRAFIPAILAAAVIAVPASATVALTATTATIGATDVGSAFTVNYNGLTGTPVSAVAGLSAATTFSLASVANSGKSWTFNYTLDNTSVAPVLASRVSVFGFDVNHALAKGSSASGTFGASTGTGNVPNALPDIDICFRAGGGGSNCAGGGGGGITASDAVASGTFTLKFAAAQSSLALSNFYARYQSLNVTGNNASSASGMGTVYIAPVVGAVPEPATWGMMILGFGMVGAGMRRRKVAAVAA